MKGLFALILAAFALAGCNSASDVSSNDVRDKEKQIEDASNKLNNGQPPQEQGQQGNQ